VHICTEFLQPIRRFVCHARPILQHISRTLPSILKNVRESTLYPVGPPVSSSNADAERARWGMPQLGNGGKGEFAIHWIVHSDLGRRICPNISRENLLHKSLVVDVDWCLDSCAYRVSMVRESSRKVPRGRLVKLHQRGLLSGFETGRRVALTPHTCVRQSKRVASQPEAKT
jgi:hypothetical protein